MPAGDGTFYLYLHEQVRTASGTGVGDRVEVELRFDDAYRNDGRMDNSSLARNLLSGTEELGDSGRRVGVARSGSGEDVRLGSSLIEVERRGLVHLRHLRLGPLGRAGCPELALCLAAGRGAHGYSGREARVLQDLPRDPAFFDLSDDAPLASAEPAHESFSEKNRFKRSAI